MKYILGFGRFWYDFIVGDSVALAIGGVGVLIAGKLLVEAGGSHLVEFAMPAIAIATLGVSLVTRRR